MSAAQTVEPIAVSARRTRPPTGSEPSAPRAARTGGRAPAGAPRPGRRPRSPTGAPPRSPSRRRPRPRRSAARRRRPAPGPGRTSAPRAARTPLTKVSIPSADQPERPCDGRAATAPWARTAPVATTSDDQEGRWQGQDQHDGEQPGATASSLLGDRGAAGHLLLQPGEGATDAEEERPEHGERREVAWPARPGPRPPWRPSPARPVTSVRAGRPADRDAQPGSPASASPQVTVLDG